MRTIELGSYVKGAPGLEMPIIKNSETACKAWGVSMISA